MKLKPGTEIGTVTATNIVPNMKVSNEAEVTESEIVSSMLAQLGSDVLKDTSDMVRSGVERYPAKAGFVWDERLGIFIAESCPRTDK